MKTNTDAKRVLLYGDSLVYGKKPVVFERFDNNIRFSGVAQDILGDQYEVLEEGLRARMLQGENKFFPERDGLKQFGPIIGSHLAIDLLVLSLGSNDCNSGGNVTEEVVKKALNEYLQKLKDWAEFLVTPLPKVLILIPPAIDESCFDEGMGKVFGPGSAARQRQLESTMVQYAKDHSIDYLLASNVCDPANPGDGVHLDEAGNRALGKALATKIQTLV